VLVSDMAPLTTGNPEGDHYDQIALARRGLELAAELVKPGGGFVCKVFDGPDAQDFQAEVRAIFAKVKRMKPEAVRKESREFFLIGQERRPRVDAPVSPPAAEPS
jgi:23S rRNA (uridine2552-2'-O)-methyltransferase